MTLREQPIPIIVGHGGYVVLVDQEAHCCCVVRSDHRGIHGPGTMVTFVEAGSEEKAIQAAVVMAWRLDQTAREETRTALNWAEASYDSDR